MARKGSRSRERRGAKKPLETPRPAQRSTFKVAQAQQELSIAVPTAVYQKPNRPESVDAGRRSTPQKRAAKPLAVTANPQRPREKTRNLPKKPLNIQEKIKCKPQPKTAKGNGTSRPFVPWCK